MPPATSCLFRARILILSRIRFLTPSLALAVALAPSCLHALSPPPRLALAVEWRLTAVLRLIGDGDGDGDGDDDGSVLGFILTAVVRMLSFCLPLCSTDKRIPFRFDFKYYTLTHTRCPVRPGRTTAMLSRFR